MIRVQSVRPDSIAQEVGIGPGSCLFTINDHDLRDALDLMFYEADAKLIVEGTEPDGAPVVYDIEKDPNLVLGIVPEPDKVRRCTNACPFCFVKGNPKVDKLRANLYITVVDPHRAGDELTYYPGETNVRLADMIIINKVDTASAGAS